MEVELLPIEQRHVDELLGAVRQADRDEAWALGRFTPAEGLRRALAFSSEAWAATHAGQLICILGVGVGSLIGGHYHPWLIGHQSLDRHARAFARDSRPLVQRWAEQYRQLDNFVDARNTQAIRWLRWSGFDIQQARPHGVDRLPFHRFELRKV